MELFELEKIKPIPNFLKESIKVSRGLVTEAASPWADNDGVVPHFSQYHPFGCECVTDAESTEVISDISPSLKFRTLRTLCLRQQQR